MSDNKNVFIYEMTILERHLDTMGHVNNATYLEIFEEARWDFITKNGFGLKEVQESSISPIVLEAQIKFRKEIHNRELIRVETRCMEQLGQLRLLVEQKIINAKGQVATTAIFTFAALDLKLRKMVQPPERFLKAWGLS